MISSTHLSDSVRVWARIDSRALEAPTFTKWIEQHKKEVRGEKRLEEIMWKRIGKGNKR